MEVTIGGERLGSGKKNKAYLHNYERSTHDMGYMWRSTMSSGTLVPYMVELGLAGDTFDIDLNADIMTHPTIGPLFGSYKVQLDVFMCPLRLYQGKLHMNMLGIGLKMQDVKLPVLRLNANKLRPNMDVDNQQINSSSILSYLGIRGLGNSPDAGTLTFVREFNGVPFLAYWDIYKNYYANKQEGIGAVIHADITQYDVLIGQMALSRYNEQYGTIPLNNDDVYVPHNIYYDETSMIIKLQVPYNGFNFNSVRVRYQDRSVGAGDIIYERPITEIFQSWEIDDANNWLIGRNWIGTERRQGFTSAIIYFDGYTIQPTISPEQTQAPKIETFPLDNIDKMRMNILKAVDQESPFDILGQELSPYSLINQVNSLDDGSGTKVYSQQYGQEGLALKTYQSDLFNNWIDTEWIDGDNGINAITAIDTSEGSFTIDEMLLSKKVYDMMNRIAISGGTYDDWQNAVYMHEGFKNAENPIYMGGLIKELTFQEVISNTQTEEQPLGTLAGRGVMTQKHKGGDIKVRVNEASYIIGIISLTPRVDYSQGNKWDVNVKTMDDLHKPALDEIGFQDLITDQMAYFDTRIFDNTAPQFQSAGKVPAWINYMTNVNQVRGNFAVQSDQMFMTLNRRYEVDWTEEGYTKIKDLTTYIDPKKFNHIFADTRLDAQNFWSQVKVGITARRKMSAKVMPNL